MAIQQPTTTDKLSTPDHSLAHRVFAIDNAAPAQTVVVDSSGITKIGDADGSNYAQVSATGNISFAGTGKGTLLLRPQIVSNRLIKTGGTWELCPTPVSLGVWNGYSMPIYNNDNEELFFRLVAPSRWDGVSNPNLGILVALSNGEDVGDKFKFNFDWNNTSGTGAVEADLVTAPVEITVIADHSVQYSTYLLEFELVYNDAGLQQTLLGRNCIAGRLQRVAAGSPQVTNEIVVFDWVVSWQVDKVFNPVS